METTPGKRVQQLREAKGFKTLTAFSEHTGVEVGTLSALEKDKSAPSLATLAKLVQTFPDLNPDWLLLGTGPMLRDGRVLTLVATEELTPTRKAGPTTGQELAAYADTLRLIGQMEARIGGLESDKASLREDVVEARTEIRRLRDILISLGKSPDSPDAAGPIFPAPYKPVAGFLTEAQRMELAQAFNELIEEEMSEGQDVLCR